MSPIAIICFSALILLLFSFFKKGTDIFSPGRLFTIIWLLAIGLAELKLSRFQREWTNYSWFTLLVPIFSFLLGIFIIYVIYQNVKLSPIKNIREDFNKLQINKHLLFRIIIVLFVLYSISFLVTYLIRGFVPMFTKLPDVARTEWGVFGYGTFVHSIPTLLYLCLLYLFLVRKNYNNKILIGLIFLLSFFTYSMILQRFYLILPFVLLMVTLYYKTYKLSFRNNLIALLIFGLIFFGISLIRVGHYAINILYYISDMKYSVDYAIFTEPYMYVIMNLENYAKAVQKLDIFSYGFYTSDFLLYATGVRRILLDNINFVEHPHIITKAYNTYTMFFIYYRDFGLFGVLFVPMMVGGLVTLMYFRMRKSPNFINISLYGVCVFIVIFSFFVPILHWLHFVFNITLIYLATYFIITNNKLKKRGLF